MVNPNFEYKEEDIRMIKDKLRDIQTYTMQETELSPVMQAMLLRETIQIWRILNHEKIIGRKA